MPALPSPPDHELPTPPPGAKWWGYILAGLAYAVCFTLAFPPFNIWPLTLIAIIPLVWAGCRAAGCPKRGALLVSIGTLPFWTYQHLWMWDVAPPGVPGLAITFSLYTGLFVWIIAHARRAETLVPMSVIVPFVWTALEVIRGEYMFGSYCWFLAGHPLIDAPPLAAPGAVVGAYGVSFLVAAIAGAVADAAQWSCFPRRVGVVGAGAIAALWFVLSLPFLRTEFSASVVRIGVIQTNLPQDNKMGWATKDRIASQDHFLDLSRRAALSNPKPDAICWPETMFPGRALNPEAIAKLDGFFYGDHRPVNQFAADLAGAQAKLGIPMLIGCEARDGDLIADINVRGRPEHSRIFNSVVVLNNGHPLADRYDKVELMPFGEVIPLLSRWPTLQSWVVHLGAAGMEFELSPGSRLGGLDIPISRADFGRTSIRAATPICYEATRSDLCRLLVRGESGGGRAELLINFSNDGWFGWWDGGRRQHMLAARWRCVELNLPMVRCVNTGVSCLIDSRGRIVNQNLADRDGPNERTDGVLLASVSIAAMPRSTIFELVGLIPAYIVMFTGLVGTLMLWRRSRQVARAGV